MPTIDLKDNPAQYRVEVSEGRYVSLNMLELADALIAAGATAEDATPAQMVAAVKKVAKADEIGGMTDSQIFALGSAIALHYETAGNVPEPLRTSQRPTESVFDRKG